MTERSEYLLAYIDSLLLLYTNDGRSYFVIDNIIDYVTRRGIKSVAISNEHLKKIIDKYVREGKIIQDSDPVMGEHFEISPNFIADLITQRNTEESILGRANKFGDVFFMKALEGVDLVEEIHLLTDSNSNPGAIPVGTDASNGFGEVADDLSDIVKSYEEMGLLDDDDSSDDLGFTLYEDDLVISDEHGDSISVTLPEKNSLPSLRRIKIPASNRIVQLNHNSQDYQNAVEAVDAVINAVAGDNEYGNEFPEEKETVVSALKAGRKLLDAKEVRPIALGHILFPVLQYIADNFTKGVIAALGATAMAAVMGLI